MSPRIRNAGKALLQRFYSPQRFLWRLPAEQPVVALTFDDGPDPVYTPAVLDLLAVRGLKATFFLIGQKVERHADLVRRIAGEGHGIGGHTWAHREVVGLSQAELETELASCRRAIRDVTGVDTVLFRPPRGRIDLTAIRRIGGLGYCLVHWTKTYSDYRRDGAERLMSRFRRDQPAARDIILLHDHNVDTVAALTGLLPEWQAEGIEFAPISS